MSAVKRSSTQRAAVLVSRDKCKIAIRPAIHTRGRSLVKKVDPLRLDDARRAAVMALPQEEDDRIDQQFEQSRGDQTADHWVAMRFITSAPVCVTGDHIIGSKPKRIAQTVMIFGRMRWTAPS